MSRTTTKIIIAQKDGTVVGQYFLGQGEHLIGRETHCTIQLEADQVSREHANLIISADAIEIEDLNSTSGTFVDGITVKGRIPIQPGQKLWISDLYIDIERQGFGGLVEGSRLGNGRFTLKRELGRGGMGAVWLALDEEVQENVALKLVSDGVALDPKGLKDLQREVNKSHQLVHPNIVRMGFFWKEEGEPAFISLEYVDGTDLHQLRLQSPAGILKWDEVQSYMLQLCDALEYAHTQNVAHRDIKPSNFLIDRQGNLKLADFGIAASLANTGQSFTATSVLGSGTPPYMSPQQLQGKHPEVTDDIYSVGATFYDLLTSMPPFYQGEVAHQVMHVPATPMGDRLKELGLRNDIPAHVGAIVMACLHKDPDKRPQSMRDIRKWIQTGEEGAITEEDRKDTESPVAVGSNCPQCNAAVQPNQDICTICGTNLHAVQPASSGGKIKLIVIIAGGVLTLVVVVALISVLAKAKRRSQTLQSTDNQRLISQAYVMYLHDNDGWYPVVEGTASVGGKQGNTLDGEGRPLPDKVSRLYGAKVPAGQRPLNKYVGMDERSLNVFHDPSDTGGDAYSVFVGGVTVGVPFVPSYWESFGNSYRPATEDKFRVKRVIGLKIEKEGSYEATSMHEQEMDQNAVTKKIIQGDWNWPYDGKRAWHGRNGDARHIMLFGDGHIEQFVFPPGANWYGLPPDSKFTWW